MREHRVYYQLELMVGKQLKLTFSYENAKQMEMFLTMILVRHAVSTDLKWPLKVLRVGTKFSQCPVVRWNVRHGEDRVALKIPFLQTQS